MSALPMEKPPEDMAYDLLRAERQARMEAAQDAMPKRGFLSRLFQKLDRALDRIDDFIEDRIEQVFNGRRNNEVQLAVNERLNDMERERGEPALSAEQRTELLGRMATGADARRGKDKDSVDLPELASAADMGRANRELRYRIDGEVPALAGAGDMERRVQEQPSRLEGGKDFAATTVPNLAVDTFDVAQLAGVGDEKRSAQTRQSGIDTFGGLLKGFKVPEMTGGVQGADVNPSQEPQGNRVQSNEPPLAKQREI